MIQPKGHTPHHLSASSISQYLRCPASYYWNRIEGVVVPPNASMRFGSAVHLALQAYHQDQDAMRTFMKWWTHFTREMDEAGIHYSPDAERLGLKLLDLYDQDPMPEGEPEQRWTYTHPDVDVPLWGVFDLCGPTWIGEFKTAAWPWGEDRPAKEFQGWLYAAVFEAVTGRPFDTLVYTILSMNPKPALSRVTVSHAAAQMDQAIDTAKAVLRSMRSGVWTPRCPKGQCDFPDLCVQLGREPDPEERIGTATLVAPSGARGEEGR